MHSFMRGSPTAYKTGGFAISEVASYLLARATSLHILFLPCSNGHVHDLAYGAFGNTTLTCQWNWLWITLEDKMLFKSSCAYEPNVKILASRAMVWSNCYFPASRKLPSHIVLIALCPQSLLLFCSGPSVICFPEELPLPLLFPPYNSMVVCCYALLAK